MQFKNKIKSLFFCNSFRSYCGFANFVSCFVCLWYVRECIYCVRKHSQFNREDQACNILIYDIKLFEHLDTDMYKCWRKEDDNCAICFQTIGWWWCSYFLFSLAFTLILFKHLWAKERYKLLFMSFRLAFSRFDKLILVLHLHDAISMSH